MREFDQINTLGIELESAFNLAEKSEKSRDFSPMINGVTVGLSSGTSGNRGVFLASSDERAQWVAAVLDRVIGLSLRKRSVAFFLRANSNLYDSIKSNMLQFEFFDLLSECDIHVKRLNKLNPTILVAQPSLLLELAHEFREGKLSIKPEKIISVAEVLYPEDKEFLESTFGQTIHQVYQCTEGFLASTCKNGILHFHEDFFIIEKNYLDEDKTRFHPIITDLERKSQPVIRYELNDIIQAQESCSCGSNWLAIKTIEGRSDDILIFDDKDGKSKIIFPDFFRRAIFMASESIREYCLIQSSTTALELFIVGDDQSYKNVEQSIFDLLDQQDITGITINPIDSTKTEKGSKLRRIRNESN